MIQYVCLNELCREPVKELPHDDNYASALGLRCQGCGGPVEFQPRHSSVLPVKVVVLPGGQLPRRMTDGAAGWDCHARLDGEVHLPYGSRQVIPLGFRVELPPGWEMQVRPRSGLARDRGIAAVFGTVDSDYRGEACATLICHVDSLRGLAVQVRPYRVKPGDRVCQVVFQRAPRAVLVQVDELSPSRRGEGGHGSTGQ